MQGSVKHVDTAIIEELDQPFNGRSFAFSLKVKNDRQYFAGEDEQDRLNWIVECIKMRPIQEIIDMCDSNPRLSRHAAMALCNQSSNPTGTIQLEIVEKGGVVRLLDFIADDKEPDEKLYDAIYFAIAKLATRVDNRPGLLVHLERFVNLACKPSGNPVWRSSAGSFIHEMAHDPKICRVMQMNGTMARLVDLLVMDKKAPPILQREAAATLELLSQDPDIRRDLGLDFILPLVDAIPAASKQAQPPLVRTLISISQDQEVFARIVNLPELLPTVLSLLSHHRSLPEEDVQQPASSLVIQLSEFEQNSLSIDLKGLRCLMCGCAAKQPDAVRNTLLAMRNFLRHRPNLATLTTLEQELIPLITLLGDQDQQIQSLATTLIRDIVSDAEALPIFTLIPALVEALMDAIIQPLSSHDDEVVQAALVSLASLTMTQVKIPLAQRLPLLQQLVQLVNTSIVGPSLYFAIKIFENCVDLPLIRHHIATAATQGFLDVFKSQNDSPTLISVANIFAVCATDPQYHGVVFAAIPIFVTCLQRITDPAVRNALLRILRNAMFYGAQEATAIASQVADLIPPLILVPELRDQATIIVAYLAEEPAMKTAILQHLSIENLYALLLPAALSSLQSSNAILTILRIRIKYCQPGVLARELLPEPVTGLIHLISSASPSQQQQQIPELAYLVLIKAMEHQEGSEIADFLVRHDGFQLALNSILHAHSEAVKEHAARAVRHLLHTEQHQQQLVRNPQLMQMFCRCFGSQNLFVLRIFSKILELLAANNTEQALLLPYFSTVAPLWYFHDPIVKKHLADAIIHLFSAKSGNLELSSIPALASILQSVSKAKAGLLPAPWTFELPKAGASPRLQLQTRELPPLTLHYESVDELHAAIADVLIQSLPQPPEPAAVHMQAIEDAYTLMQAQHPSMWTTEAARAVNKIIFQSVLQQISDQPNATTRKHRKRTSGTSKNSPTASSSRIKKSSRDKKNSPLSPQHHANSDIFLHEPFADPTISRATLLATVAYRNAADPIFYQHEQSTRTYLDLMFKGCHCELPPTYQPSLYRAALRPSTASSEMLGIGPSPAIVSYLFTDNQQAACIQADHPFSPHLQYSYFEVLILNSGTRGTIGIGVTPADYSPLLQPGWLPGSFAYHGDDGNKYGAPGSLSAAELANAESDLIATLCKHDAYGPTFTTNDIIGCGYNSLTKEIFFTKNGQYLGVAFTDVPPGLYPTVGLASPAEQVFVNLGQLPFLFDFTFQTNATYPVAPKADPNSTAVAPRIFHPYPAYGALARLSRDWSYSDRSVLCSLAYFSQLITKKTSL